MRLLWDACQIPDYRQLLSEAHARLVGSVFLQLADHGGIEHDFLASQVLRLDDASGDIELLLQRMAFIRTWTYVSSHADWVEDPAHWQETTRAIEDRLSDALHARLVERFVDKTRPGRSRGEIDAARAGHPFAALARLAAPAAVAPAEDWVARLADAPHGAFRVDAQGRIESEGRVLGVLTRGPDVLRPEVRLTLDDQALAKGAASRLQRRLVAFARDLVSELFASLDSSGPVCSPRRPAAWSISSSTTWAPFPSGPRVSK